MPIGHAGGLSIEWLWYLCAGAYELLRQPICHSVRDTEHDLLHRAGYMRPSRSDEKQIMCAVLLVGWCHEQQGIAYL